MQPIREYGPITYLQQSKRGDIFRALRSSLTSESTNAIATSYLLFLNLG